METKVIKIKVFSAYSKSTKPWYITKQKMTRKQFDAYVKDWKVQEFKQNDSWRCDSEQTYSWKQEFICTLHD